MIIEIPVWVLWTLGVVVGFPLVATILILAWFGWTCIK